jgi:hypothetical protein
MTDSLIQLAHGSDDAWIDSEIVAGTGLRTFCHAAGEVQPDCFFDLDRTDQVLNCCYTASGSAMETSGARSLPRQ